MTGRADKIQINTIAPGFDASTRLRPTSPSNRGIRTDRSFGGGHPTTGRVYDTQDLTTPLVTIHVEAPTYNEGQCGFLSFSRAGTSGSPTSRSTITSRRLRIRIPPSPQSFLPRSPEHRPW